MKKILTSLFLSAAMAIGTIPAHAEDGDPIRYAIWSNPKGTFHPTLYFTDYDRAVIFSVFSRLVTLDEKQNPQPSLAESWDYSEDGRTLTLHLRKGVKWHDGQPFTAEDVAYTYQAEAAPDFPRDRPPFVKYLEGFEDYSTGKADSLPGIQVVDDVTVAFTFKAPYAAAFAHFADKPVLAKHIWDKIPLKTWNEASEALRNPVGTGPYKFVEFKPDQYVRLERNDDYFGGQPRTKTIIFRISNTQTAQSELINGELDIAEISSWNERDLQTYRDAGLRIVEQRGTSGQYLPFDTRNPKLSDKRVRQAIIHAINRQAIVDRLLFGHGAVFNTNAHPDSPYYPAGLDPYAYDPQKARELLAEAGWKDSDGDGILDRDGQKFVFTLNYPTGNRTRELSAPIIQQNLKAVGIETELVSADFNTTLAILQDPERSFDGVLMGGTFRPGIYDNNFWWERFTSPDLTGYADAFNSSVYPGVLRENIGAWLKGVNDEAIRVWLYIPNQGYVLGPKVTDYESHPYEPFAGIQNWAVSR
ncbi:ABC transporter substrate-binding protein [Sinirhodobacter populi]|uniref:ABC transporter substrate-binding protein n=1 Tax=Paenirhodobacter populi TaxID=2306993 RepID=A0A443K3L7_9RHOB|nr:ABC transporter substrate-binding protein [Sinirhodobacter populi]RWR27359.1 ABC transporter substrate-binding protein [Sinirhodobacter populi]